MYRGFGGVLPELSGGFLASRDISLYTIEIGFLVHIDFTNHSVYGETFRRVIRIVPRVPMLLVCDNTSSPSSDPISGAASSSFSSSDPADFLRVVVKDGVEPSCSILAAER